MTLQFQQWSGGKHIILASNSVMAGVGIHERMIRLEITRTIDKASDRVKEADKESGKKADDKKQTSAKLGVKRIINYLYIRLNLFH